MKRILLSVGLALLMQSAWAIDLHDAKQQGLVGEANNGFLAAVSQPVNAEVQSLIREVNAKRRQEFEQAARNSGATLEQVAVRFYQLAVQRTAPGHYYQDANGSWQRK